MTVNEFRKLALSFPEAIESAHMHHPDFRVGGKIFATLACQGRKNELCGMPHTKYQCAPEWCTLERGQRIAGRPGS